MTKLQILACSTASLMFVNGCTQILEPVSLLGATQDVSTMSAQEDFDINIQSLTFENARKANNAPYPRQLMLTGIGARANVFDETDFSTSKIPPLSLNENYLLGVGDKLSYLQLIEFSNLTTEFPTQSENSDYLLGVGDELTLLQLSNEVSGLNANALNMVKKDPDGGNERDSNSQPSKGVLKVSGIIGTDGNILLLGLGSIRAKNRSLNEIQTEVRNILIRNGLTPNFQLEITGFNSQKAFVTFAGVANDAEVTNKNIISITNLPVTLKEVALGLGLQSSVRETLAINLVRNGEKFRMTGGQVFNNSSANVVILDRDQIEIFNEELANDPTDAVVGSNGKILLPNIGSLDAKNRSLAEVHADIAHILLEQGMIPSFQLEITDFKSKKFFLTSQSLGSKSIILTTSELTLKEAVLANRSGLQISANGVGVQSGNNFTAINLIRAGSSYRMTFNDVLNGRGSKVFIQDGDTIELENFKYKPGQVFALGGAGKAQLIPIDPSKRETLADVLFTPDGPLNNLLAKRSEVYLLRGQNPSVAYHLDAQNVSRILVAAKTELRPNDIVYVADRPIISFSRTLNELIPFRTLLSNIQSNNFP